MSWERIDSVRQHSPRTESTEAHWARCHQLIQSFTACTKYVTKTSICAAFRIESIVLRQCLLVYGYLVKASVEPSDSVVVEADRNSTRCHET